MAIYGEIWQEGVTRAWLARLASLASVAEVRPFACVLQEATAIFRPLLPCIGNAIVLAR